MSYEQKNNEGRLFINDRKEQQTQPDFKGSAKIDGADYWLSAWSNKDKNGKEYITLRLSKKERQATKPNLKVVAGTLAEQMDDSIPF